MAEAMKIVDDSKNGMCARRRSPRSLCVGTTGPGLIVYRRTSTVPHLWLGDILGEIEWEVVAAPEGLEDDRAHVATTYQAKMGKSPAGADSGA